MLERRGRDDLDAGEEVAAPFDRAHSLAEPADDGLVEADVAQALLDAVIDEAKRRGYAQVRLDVVDTNPRAKALYRHVGFKELKTVKIGPLKHIFGFSASTTMVCDV
ncbi:GNAT family N-acetyltransferase [Yoonia sp.]|uniref:GNAT family N-acetyltransferase n=1 Tax=Yoonia sp. TaxID=2212373 RepID=UPI0039752EE3